LQEIEEGTVRKTVSNPMTSKFSLQAISSRSQLYMGIKGIKKVLSSTNNFEK
jgi:hypothetical protein